MASHLIVVLMAVLIGVVAGLRSLTAPAAVAWAAHCCWHNWDNITDSNWASWVGSLTTAVVLTVLAVGELVTDKLPRTPARTAPVSFVGRIVAGGFAGAVIGGVILNTPSGFAWTGMGAGILGAVLGTVGGYHARRKLVALIGGRDLPIALLEDAVAILGGLGVVAAVAGL